MIITRTPMRISIGGGGTNLPSYHRQFGGFVISAAVKVYGMRERMSRRTRGSAR
jgi:D-glycero-alpha-D-manno-heptose-7-phosphate kinase